MYYEAEPADCTSDDHEVHFREYLNTIDFFVVCKVKVVSDTATLATNMATRQMGPWRETDCTCLWCDEVFSIINPDPVNQDLS